MKTNYILIALTMLAALTMVSCKNNKKAQSQEPTQEEVQEMKQALADSVLEYVDALAEQLYCASSKSFRVRDVDLTNSDKMVKPDYLLDPSLVGTFITKSQKVNALAIYLTECVVRELFDMPQEETKEAIVKLATEVNHPMDLDYAHSGAPLSEKVKSIYESCKDRGDLAYFWQFEYAFLIETDYILAQDPELFFSKMTEEQWQSYFTRKQIWGKAVEELAKYDEEMAMTLNLFNAQKFKLSTEELNNIGKSIEAAKHLRYANKDKYIAKRNALLQ